MMLRLRNSWTDVAMGDPLELEWLRSFLSVENQGVEYKRRALASRGVNREIGDRVSLVRKVGRAKLHGTKSVSSGYIFPTGLVPLVHAGLRRKGWDCQVLDMRGKPEPADPLRPVLEGAPWHMTGSYAHQSDALAAWAEGESPIIPHTLPGRGIVWAPTGSGKGRLAVAVAANLPAKWVFAVHRNHLVEDIRERWQALTGEKAGVIGHGKWSVGETLTCATIQSLYAARGTSGLTHLTATTTGLIVDECHTAAASTFAKTIQSFESAYYRIGLSGTPLDRSDQRALISIGAIGPVVYRIKAKVLQERGVLAVPTVNVIPIYQETPHREWDKVYQDLVVDSDHRNGAVIHAMSKSMENGHLPGIVFVRRIKHGYALAKMARRKGHNVKVVEGKTPLLLRQDACDQLGSGRLDWVIATKVFTEGVNIPALHTVICAQGGKSIADTIQQIGRGMRVTKTKSSLTVWEIGDKGNDFLHRHAKVRIGACQREGYQCVVVDNFYPERER